MLALHVRLVPPCVSAVRALACFEEIRGDHVTLVHDVSDPSAFDPTWVPGGHAIGDAIELTSVGMCRDDRVQVLVVEIGGTTRRPLDGGVLHVTISHRPGVRSHEANDLLVGDPEPTPLVLRLGGTVTWFERPTDPFARPPGTPNHRS